MRDAKFRRKQNTMVVCGWGVLVLSVWSVLRLIMAIVMEYQDYVNRNLLPILTEEEQNKTLILIMIIFILLFSVLDTLVRVVICQAANAEGRGRRKKGFYLVLMGYIMFESLLNIASYSYMFFTDEQHLMEEILAGLLLSVTEFVITVDLFSAAVYVRKIMRKERKIAAKEKIEAAIEDTAGQKQKP